MHTVMWTFKVPAGTAKTQLVDTINATAPSYEGIPGLIRKYYGIAPDGSSLVGIYLWESKAAADAFYTADWVAMVTKRWAGPPLVCSCFGRGSAPSAASLRRTPCDCWDTTIGRPGR